MNTNQALNWGQQELPASCTSSPNLDAEILLAHSLQQTRTFVLGHGKTELTPEQESTYRNLIKQRRQHWPLAYLTGQQEFYDLKFTVNQAVLIPRPETELIIDDILDQRYNLNAQTTILDLGTGSGCIIITLAKHLHNITKHFLAIDISESALAVAKHNAQQHQQQINFLLGNLLKPILNQPQLITNDLIITANLPYLDQTWRQLLTATDSKALQYEPSLALAGGTDGLDYYRQLVKQINKLLILRPELNIKLYCEINQKQVSAFKQIFTNYNIQIKPDLAGLDRLAIVKNLTQK